MRLLLLLLVCLFYSDSLKCHKMLFPDDANYLGYCRITLNVTAKTVEWNTLKYDCERERCTESNEMVHCCCKSADYCNTLEFAIRTAAEENAPFHHYFACVILATVFCIQAILLTCCYFKSTLRPHSETLPSYLHIDFTDILTRANITSRELEVTLQPAAEEEEELFAIRGTAFKVVVTYTCDKVASYRDQTKKLEDVDDESSFEEIFEAVLKCGPQEIKYEAATVIRILKEVTEIFKRESNLIMVNPPIAIYGDTHGQYSDLWRWFHINGWPSTTRSLFMGDYVDRGRHSTEVFVLLSLLKILYPNNIYLLRGNHEDGGVNRTYSFFNEVETRFQPRGEEVFLAFEKFFASLPMSGLIGSRILCCHGGLSPDLPTLADIEAISRPTNPVVTKDDDYIGLLWSDPGFVAKFEPNIERDETGNGIGYIYGVKQIRKFCRQNQLGLLLRGHQPPMHGYEHFCSKQMTIFSAPGYRTEQGISNLGAALLVDVDGRIVFVRLSPDGTVQKRGRRCSGTTST